MLRAVISRGSGLSRHESYRCNSTMSKEEIETFRKQADSWWDITGAGFKPLHAMNSLRIQFIQDGLINSGSLKQLEYPKPLKDITVMDVGCGGGILSEPLARLGATVTGLDAAEESIIVAKSHMDKSLNIKYVFSTIEKFAEENPDASFDAIVASEVIEHVDNPDLFLKVASKLLKPKGSLFVTTNNRTIISGFLSIIAAEYILGLVQKGTHEYQRFLRPQEVQLMLSNYGIKTRMIKGMCYNPLTNNWFWTPGTPVSYALHAVKVGV